MFTIVTCFFAILMNQALGYNYSTSPANFAPNEPTVTKPATVSGSKINPVPYPWTGDIIKK